MLVHAGDLGTLPRPVEGMEHGDFSSVAEPTDELGIIPEQIAQAETNVTIWVYALGHSEAPGVSREFGGFANPFPV